MSQVKPTTANALQDNETERRSSTEIVTKPGTDSTRRDSTDKVEEDFVPPVNQPRRMSTGPGSWVA